MRTKMKFLTSCLTESTFLRSSKLRISIACVFALMSFTSNSVYADRFSPPSLKLQLNNFDSRLEGNIFNVDFLLAHVINNSRKTVREVGEITDTVEGLLYNTAIFNNSDSATAGSVVIPPGTSADTIIIINVNEGDSIAIQR